MSGRVLIAEHPQYSLRAYRERTRPGSKRGKFLVTLWWAGSCIESDTVSDENIAGAWGRLTLAEEAAKIAKREADRAGEGA